MMTRRLVPSFFAFCVLLTGAAAAQQAPGGTGLDGGYDAPSVSTGRDLFAGLPKPLTAEAVRQALEEQFSRRPRVGRVSEKDSATIEVEMIMPDGRSQTMLIDKQTGARQPLR